MCSYEFKDEFGNEAIGELFDPFALSCPEVKVKRQQKPIKEAINGGREDMLAAMQDLMRFLCTEYQRGAKFYKSGYGSCECRDGSWASVDLDNRTYKKCSGSSSRPSSPSSYTPESSGPAWYNIPGQISHKLDNLFKQEMNP